MIERKKKRCKCGCGKEGYIWARGYLKGHEPIDPKPLKRSPIKNITPKQREKIKENKNYYAEFIEKHPTKCCDECGEAIFNPTGSNVSHIIAAGSNPALYKDKRNAFLLCQRDENIWTNGDRTKMKIWPEAQRRRTQLLIEHYDKHLKSKWL